jgi:hypothetical protein
VVFISKSSSKVFHFVTKNPCTLSFFFLHFYCGFLLINIAWCLALLILIGKICFGTPIHRHLGVSI